MSDALKKAQEYVRDHRDKTRSVAPLTQAEDAVRIDTSQMTLREVFEAVWMRVRSAIRP